MGLCGPSIIRWNYWSNKCQPHANELCSATRMFNWGGKKREKTCRGPDGMQELAMWATTTHTPTPTSTFLQFKEGMIRKRNTAGKRVTGIPVFFIFFYEFARALSHTWLDLGPKTNRERERERIIATECNRMIVSCLHFNTLQTENYAQKYCWAYINPIMLKSQLMTSPPPSCCTTILFVNDKIKKLMNYYNCYKKCFMCLNESHTWLNPMYNVKVN